MAEITIALSLGSAAATAISAVVLAYYAYEAGKAAGITSEALRHATLDLEAITEQRERASEAHEDYQEDRQRIATDSVSDDVASVWGTEGNREEDSSPSFTVGSDSPEAIDLQTG